ncbi:dolichyl-diphosphooligosaccharide--protein glycosyltransferase subunit 1 [Coemansia sp. RSA 1286]|nr:dolichyl-diphosphooligosaccharide--protein glycosyltransferase subunit 1 [Coemansia sp. RSA 1286]
MRLPLLSTLFGALLLGARAAKPGTGLVHTNMIQTIHLDRLPYASEHLGVVVENTDSAKVHKAYDIYVPASKHRALASIVVQERKTGHHLRVYRNGESSGNIVYRAVFNNALQAGDKIGLSVDMEFVRLVDPRPKVVEQTEDQSWVWQDTLGGYAYETRKFKAVVKMGSGAKVRQVSGLNNTRDGAGNVVFGPYVGAAAVDATPVSVAFKHNGEQMEATDYRREYFVSHWANDLHVSDHYDIRNCGPALPNNGLDKVQQTMTMYTHGRDNLVKSLLVPVPTDAREFYFVDQIGNVSTSTLGPASRATGTRLLQLKPRYPIPGSWRYAWRHGFSLPLNKYLRVSGDQYSLRVPFIGHVTASASLERTLGQKDIEKKTTAVTRYSLHISLPEGASDVRVEMPFDAEYRVERSWYYFDSIGRPLVVVEMQNVPTALMDAYVVVVYRYGWMHLWTKPAVIAAFVLVLFALASGLSRLQLGLVEKKPDADGNKRKKE